MAEEWDERYWRDVEFVHDSRDHNCGQRIYLFRGREQRWRQYNQQ
jgi:hypothetical protein